jgi:hypothetical protein
VRQKLDNLQETNDHREGSVEGVQEPLLEIPTTTKYIITEDNGDLDYIIDYTIKLEDYIFTERIIVIMKILGLKTCSPKRNKRKLKREWINTF